MLGENEPWGRHLAGALAAAAILVYGLNWLKQWCLHRLSIKISIIAGNRCLSKLLWLPVEYFNHRLVGELTDRVLSIDKIAKGLSEHFLGVLIEITMSVVFLAVMVAYDPTLALIILGLAILNGLLMRVITRVQSDESHAWRREQGLLVGVGMLMLNQADRLRMNAEEGRFFSRLERPSSQGTGRSPAILRTQSLQRGHAEPLHDFGPRCRLDLRGNPGHGRRADAGRAGGVLSRGRHVPGACRAIRRARGQASSA